MSTSKPLRGTSRLTPTISRPSGSSPKRCAHVGSLVASSGTEALGVDAGRDDDDRQRDRARLAAASTAG